MAEPPKLKLDRSQITASNREIWRRKFGVSDEALEAFIKKVGNSVDAVRAELERSKKK